MGKVTGFLEYPRVEERYDAAETRKTHYREFVARLSDADAQNQAARCMDCGTPFCHFGCPINNVIPDFNDLVYRQQWRAAFEVLNRTNNFPEFTGRVCPAPCEAACTLNINAAAVGIKSIERALSDKAWEEGWITPQAAPSRSGKRVAVIGSGPAGLTAAQQLARAGHDVTVFEKRDRIGGLLRYGIPDFKLEKHHLDRRIAQMESEGVIFKTAVCVGATTLPAGVGSDATATLSAKALLDDFDAIVLAGGAEVPRDLPVPGRELAGVYYAMEFLPQQNKAVAGAAPASQIVAASKRVVVIGGGDTGSDCVGTSIRQGARSVVQIELLPQPPLQENKDLTWPYWPLKLRTSSSHEEGCERRWSLATKAFKGKNEKLEAVTTVQVEWQADAETGHMRMTEIPGSEKDIPADLAFLAMGFLHPVGGVLDALGVARDARGNAATDAEGGRPYATGVEKVFAAGDMRRGQSLVVWAIHEGRQCAQTVDVFLRR